MLNLWKKIQEKGRVHSPSKCVNVAILGPQYDGPLKDFNPADNDCVALEKCRLSLNYVNDIYDNKAAYLYFKSFLEFQMVEPLLHLYNSFVFEYNDDFLAQRNVSSKLQNDSSSTIAADIFTEMLSKLPDDLRSRILQSGIRNDDESTVNLAVVSSVLQDILLDYWTDFLRSEWYFRYQVDLLTSRAVSLGDILGHETALSYFMQFLEIEGCSVIVEFWLATCNFKQFIQNCYKNEQVDVDQILNDAITLYEKYLSLLATSPLGFSDNIRAAVEEGMCDESNGPHIDCFDPAVNIVFAFLRKNYLVPFLSSQHYVHLLSDLIRQSSSVVNHSPSSSVSDCCSDAKRSPLMKPSIHGDCNRIRKRSGLQFGHVDRLGRFQSDTEPDPDQFSESKLSRMVKKWVQRNGNKSVEEEMAWQVAEMVIKDITDMTMGNSADNCDADNSTKVRNNAE